jgi:hypothetical protein
MQLVGKVLWWDKRDREGVISDSTGIEFYFNASVFPDHAKYKNLEGRFVQFSTHSEISHMKCASSVSLVPTSSLSKAKKTFESSKQINPIDKVA